MAQIFDIWYFITYLEYTFTVEENVIINTS